MVAIPKDSVPVKSLSNTQNEKNNGKYANHVYNRRPSPNPIPIPNPGCDPESHLPELNFSE